MRKRKYYVYVFSSENVIIDGISVVMGVEIVEFEFVDVSRVVKLELVVDVVWISWSGRVVV